MLKPFLTRIVGPKTIFGLDLRALALFRFGLGVLLVLDAAMRSEDIRAFYSDVGLLPIGPYVNEFANRLHISLHLASPTEGWQALLLAFAFLAGLCVMLGYRTRLATIVSWVLVISIQNRNPMVLNGGDVLLRCLLFWAMFLPLGARWSVDAALTTGDRPKDKDNLWFGGASIALVLQVCFVYLATAALKSGREWWPEGTASYYALSLDQFTTAFGMWLVQWTTMLQWSTYGVYLLECLAGVALISSLFFYSVRTAFVVALMLLHLNFDLTMRLGLFPWIDIVALAALLPGPVFDVIGARLATPARRGLKVFYDGECGFCKKMVLVIRELLLLPETEIGPAQDDAVAKKRLEEDYSWVVVDHEGQAHVRWDAMVVVLEHSLWLGWLCRRLPLRALTPVGDAAYKLVARNRGRLGKVTKTLLPYREPQDLTPGWTANLLMLFFIGYVGLWNLRTIPESGIDILPPWNKIASVLRLDQKWNMFAPYPLKDDGWYVVDATLVDGSKVDVFKGFEGDGEPLTWEKPEQVSRSYPNARWRKYMMNIWQKSKKAHRLYYGKYLCRTWNATHVAEKQLERFDVVFMKERTMPPGEPQSVQKVTIWKHDCFKRKAVEEEGAPGAATPAPESATAPTPTPTTPGEAPAPVESESPEESSEN